MTALISELELPDYTSEKIQEFITNLRQYLESRGISHDIHADVFVDSEYTDWREVKIIAKIDLDFKTLHGEMKSEVYNRAEKILPKAILEKTLIKIEPMHWH